MFGVYGFFYNGADCLSLSSCAKVCEPRHVVLWMTCLLPLKHFCDLVGIGNVFYNSRGVSK